MMVSHAGEKDFGVGSVPFVSFCSELSAALQNNKGSQRCSGICDLYKAIRDVGKKQKKKKKKTKLKINKSTNALSSQTAMLRRKLGDICSCFMCVPVVWTPLHRPFILWLPAL